MQNRKNVEEWSIHGLKVEVALVDKVTNGGELKKQLMEGKIIATIINTKQASDLLLVNRNYRSFAFPHL